MAKWQSNTESGILRKNITPDNHEELLVFGYACKLFRDDEKALYIDKGKHLIPWMGDKNLKIDRYDGRSALSELSQFEASREGYDAMRWMGLSDSDRRIEQLCDEERYYALHINEEEEELYKEEEQKRLMQKNNEYQFNYDVQPEPEPEPEKVPTVEMEDEPFVPPPDLDVPSDIAVPSTVKENTRIEKTALFVSKQGLQMEILIKTKQSDNPQFSFLNQQDPLHKYYKHLLMIIKSGRYKVQSKENCTDEMKDDTNENEANDEHYLHPSLLATPVQSAPPPTPPLTIPYRPSANCKYLQLVNRIQGNQQQQFASLSAPTNPNPELPSMPPQGSAPAPQQLTYEQQHYYQQYYYAMQYYEYYKQMAQQYSEGELDPKILHYFQNLAQLSNFMQTQGMQNFLEVQHVQAQMPDNPYAQIVSNLVKNKEQVSFAPVTNLQQGCQQIEGNIAKAPIIYKQDQSVSSQNTPESGTPINSPKPSEPLPEPKEESKPLQKHPLLHFAHYDSDSNDSGTSEKENEEETTSKETKIDTIPEDVQLIIEKMASYVSKNGAEFENIVKAKGDPRFEFLNEQHEFHNFYKTKLDEFTATKIVNPEKDENQEKEQKKQQNASENKAKEKKAIAPVSFSIKKTKEETPKEIKSALPMEESDEDDEDNSSNVAPSSTVQSQSISTNQTNSASCSPSRTPPLKDFDQNANACSEVETNEKNKEKDLLDGEDPILEMIDLTDDAEERRESKRAEDRRKDKIAAAARERSLQLERKRKAAVFLKLMNADTSKADKKTITLSGHETTPVSSSNKSSSYHNEKTKSERHSSSSKEDSRKKMDKNSSECEEKDEKRRKSSKKKKSHKRKRSKEKHDSRHHHKDHKKSKKRRRSKSIESHTSNDS